MLDFIQKVKKFVFLPFLLLSSSLFSCSQTKTNTSALSQSSPLAPALANVLAALEVVRAEDGSMTSMQGITKAKSISSSTAILSSADLTKNAKNAIYTLSLNSSLLNGLSVSYSNPFKLGSLHLTSSKITLNDQSLSFPLCNNLYSFDFHSAPSQFSEVPTKDGEYILCLEIKDSHGNILIIDTPSFKVKTSIINPPKGFHTLPAIITSTSLNLSWSSVSEAKSYDLMLCTASDCKTSCTKTVSSKSTEGEITASGDGTFYACVRSVDEAKNQSKWLASSALLIVSPDALNELGQISQNSDNVKNRALVVDSASSQTCSSNEEGLLIYARDVSQLMVCTISGSKASWVTIDQGGSKTSVSKNIQVLDGNNRVIGNLLNITDPFHTNPQTILVQTVSPHNYILPIVNDGTLETFSTNTVYYPNKTCTGSSMALDFGSNSTFPVTFNYTGSSITSQVYSIDSLSSFPFQAISTTGSDCIPTGGISLDTKSSTGATHRPSLVEDNGTLYALYGAMPNKVGICTGSCDTASNWSTLSIDNNASGAATLGNLGNIVERSGTVAIDYYSVDSSTTPTTTSLDFAICTHDCTSTIHNWSVVTISSSPTGTANKLYQNPTTGDYALFYGEGNTLHTAFCSSSSSCSSITDWTILDTSLSLTTHGVISSVSTSGTAYSLVTQNSTKNLLYVNCTANCNNHSGTWTTTSISSDTPTAPGLDLLLSNGIYYATYSGVSSGHLNFLTLATCTASSDCTNASNWTTGVINSDSVNEHTSHSIRDHNGVLYISTGYASTLFIGTCDSNTVSCSTTENWAFNALSTGSSTSTSDNTLAVGSDNQVHILSTSFLDGGTTGAAHLWYNHCSSNCTSIDNWTGSITAPYVYSISPNTIVQTSFTLPLTFKFP